MTASPEGSTVDVGLTEGTGPRTFSRLGAAGLAIRRAASYAHAQEDVSGGVTVWLVEPR